MQQSKYPLNIVKNLSAILVEVLHFQSDLYLIGQLPDHPNHPKGRNSYAHVAICIKDKFQMSYKDIDDDKFNEVIQYIEFLKKNPS